ncbi:isoleucine--tRNA ligase [Candidatus Woesearchaeota archaeon]|nr:isoleucine--tRNA ligase [Candidatus Woesearchaeota archaeon]
MTNMASETTAAAAANPFPRAYDFKRIEESVTRLWKDKGVVEKAISYDAKKPLFSFLEGPPTANAPPALHHVEMRTIKDLVCRYKFMKGFSVPRKAGWDCHGLPVEVQVEKKLGLSTKKDVVNYGIDKFNALCRSDVFSFISEWDRLTDKMAFWIDLRDSYITLKNEYIESVWWSLQQLHKKGLLYEDFKVLPYCPRCETPLSSHEVALGYEEVTEPAITTMFQLKESPNRYLLAWTTTPWTTPGNVALAVHPDVTYAVVEDSAGAHPGKQFILANDLVGKYFKNPVIVQNMQGTELEGKEYAPLFDYFVGKLDKPAWVITLAGFVTTEEGTGIVHQAPAFGEEDYENCRKHGLAFVQPVAENGTFTKDVEDFAGLFVKDADALIIERLEKDGTLFGKENYTHTYPFCWRCSTPLIYYALKSWFIAVSKYKDRLLELNGKIAWYPDHIKHGRFGDWLANVKDWALSRNKFWGTPLPVWKCDNSGCSEEVAIGSIQELKEKAVEIPRVDTSLERRSLSPAGDIEGATEGSALIIDLHKPFIDEIKLKCGSCAGEMSRVPYVIDCWYDSGAATFAQFHYPFAKGSEEMLGKSFPYDFIAEAIDQTRGWFYTLHVLGALIFDDIAYRSVVCAGHVVDENGEKMSKSKGNVLNPWEVFEKVGVDAVRLQFCSTSPEAPKRFSYGIVSENVMPFLTVLWNSCYFASETLGKKTAVTGGDSPLKIEDKWIISRANSVVAAVEDALGRHEYHACVQALKSFAIDDFSRWYIRIIRERASAHDDALQYTFRYVVSRVVKLLAPFAPYVSEEIYQLLVREKPVSVHLSEWPKAEASDAELESQMAIARGLVESVLSARDQIQRGLKWPLKRVSVVTKDEKVKQAVRALPEVIKKQGNIKELTLADDFKEAKLRVKADYSKLEPVFGSITPKIIANLAMHSSQAVLQHIETEGSFRLEVDGQLISITKEHLITGKEVPNNYVFAQSQYGEVYVDTETTEEMELEGYERELVRRIQQARKEAGLSKEQQISLVIVLPQQLQLLKGALTEHMSDIKSKVGAFRLQLADLRPDKGAFDTEVVARIKGQSVEIFLRFASNA